MTSNGVHEVAEKRGEGRTATIFRPVLITDDDFAGFCLVRNLSPSGLMGDVYTSFSIGASVAIQFAPRLHFSGHVRWCDAGRIGVHFDNEICVAEVLAKMAAPTLDGMLNRAPRVDMTIDGQLILKGAALPMSLRDIAQKGAKVRASYLATGDEVEVCLPGMARRKAVVRWTQGDVAGLVFMTPVPFAQLAEWVISIKMPAHASVRGTSAVA